MKLAPDEADLARAGALNPDPAADSEPVPPSHATPAPAPRRPSRWPAPLAPAAMHGLAGRFVRIVGPETEADPAALLFQFILLFGIAVGRAVGFRIGATWHGLNEYAGLIGGTGSGRKGTSYEEVRSVFEKADPDFVKERLFRGGLASGEGIKYAVRDAHGDDEGVSDKRLCIFEPEFASVLKKGAREGNTISDVLRDLFDSGNLCNLTRRDPVRATGAHGGVIVHSTEEELRELLRGNDIANGFVNRFLWIAVRKSKDLPHGGAPDPAALLTLVEELRASLAFARGAGEVAFDVEAAELWESEYARLNHAHPGAFGKAVARGAAHVRRLSAIFAVLDRSTSISAAHLRAALECWRYSADTSRMIFGDSTGDDRADEILAFLRDRPEGMTKTEITAAFNNKGLERVNRALERLEEEWGLIARKLDPATNGGRQAVRFMIREAAKEAK